MGGVFGVLHGWGGVYASAKDSCIALYISFADILDSLAEIKHSCADMQGSLTDILGFCADVNGREGSFAIIIEK